MFQIRKNKTPMNPTQVMVAPNIYNNDEIYKYLSSRKDTHFSNTVEFIEKPTGTYFAFQARFTNTKWGLSISCPPGIYQHAQTALLLFSDHNKDDYKLEYVDDWDYQDDRRFSSNGELIAEIKRIRKCIDRTENLAEEVPLPKSL